MRFLFFICLFIFFINCSIADNLTDTPPITTHSLQLREEISASMGTIDENTASVSLRLTDPEISEETTISLIATLTDANPAVVSIAFISPEAVIRAIYPETYDSFMGSSLSTFIPADGLKGPVFSAPDTSRISS